MKKTQIRTPGFENQLQEIHTKVERAKAHITKGKSQKNNEEQKQTVKPSLKYGLTEEMCAKLVKNGVSEQPVGKAYSFSTRTTIAGHGDKSQQKH